MKITIFEFALCRCVVFAAILLGVALRKFYGAFELPCRLILGLSHQFHENFNCAGAGDADEVGNELSIHLQQVRTLRARLDRKSFAFLEIDLFSFDFYCFHFDAGAAAQVHIIKLGHFSLATAAL